MVEDLGPGDLGTMLRGAVREVHDTVEHLAEIREEARYGMAEPKDLVKKAMSRDVDVGLAAETVLEYMEAPSQEAVKAVMQVVATEGITREDADVLVESLQARGDCE